METIRSFKGMAAMDTVKSFKGYGKVNEEEDRKFRHETKKRIIIIVVSVIIIALIIGIAIGITMHKHSSTTSPTSMASSIKALCSITRYPDSCISSISSAKGSNTTSDPKVLFEISMNVAVDEINRVSALTDTLSIPSNDKRLSLAIDNCKELFNDAIDQLKQSVTTLQDGLSDTKIDDIRSWLSAAVTDQETCLDGFDGTTGDYKHVVESAMANSTEFTSNSLAIATNILKLLNTIKYFKIHRKLLAVQTKETYTDFPRWVSNGQRRILQQSVDQLSANVTVSKDGTGQVKTIKEAVDLVPKKNAYPFLIYVKAGVYKENVVLDKNKWNVVVFGDGMYKTVVDGKLNFIDGTPTFSTATFITAGKNFMARDVGFKNSAGPDKHQAVALRSGSDHSVFYRCSFDGFQDTLYTHSNRQFYRECDIAGTIDFIFGDATVIFQNCQIRPRQALPNQQNTITAQGKKDPNESTGTSIQACTITPYDNNVTVPTYLGRPWKDYSTTIIMQSDIGAFVHYSGWMPWVIGSVPPSTINYGEYHNTGPGSSVARRVNWPGYNPSVSDEEAAKYTVGIFLKGSDWLPATGVQFQATLEQ